VLPSSGCTEENRYFLYYDSLHPADLGFVCIKKDVENIEQVT
jgi:hypothetical protein